MTDSGPIGADSPGGGAASGGGRPEGGSQPFRWFVPGDFNGFFGLMFDNLTVLSFLAFILTVLFGYPADIVYTRMFPGTAAGVMFGDLVYSWMAFRLARKTGNPNVTAMPLGLDTPSTIGVAFTVLGPCFIAMKGDTRLTPEEAAMATWYVGMATMVLIGIIKLVFSFTGSFLQRIIPQAGLLGSLAGIGLALIGFLPMLEIFGAPVVGLVALGLILYNLVARIKLPGGFPGVAASVGIGTALYYLLAPAGMTGGVFAWPTAELHLGFPTPNVLWIPYLGAAMTYFPIAFPFAVLTVVGGINVTESARVGGDDYNTRDILLTEALATILAGVCGGVAQSTPYIGQPAYKAMGSRAGYTVITGLFVGLGGIFGYLSLIVEWIPKSVLAPILIFVALDIMVQAFLACPARHAPAVALAYVPTVARLVEIKLTQNQVFAGPKYGELLAGIVPDFGHDKVLPDNLVTIALGNGFILTAMLWGAVVACMIDRKLRMASLYLVVLSSLSFFGIVHSVDPDGRMYVPWGDPAPTSRLQEYLDEKPPEGQVAVKPSMQQLQAAARQVPYQFSAAYMVMALMMLGFSLTPQSKEPFPEDEIGHG